MNSRFFIRKFPEDSSSITLIRLTYNSTEVSKWLDSSPSAIRAYRTELRKRLTKAFPDAEIVLKGVPKGYKKNAWTIGSGISVDMLGTRVQCECILAEVVKSKNDWLPQKRN